MDAAARNLLAGSFSQTRSRHGVEFSELTREAAAAFLSVILLLAAVFLLARRMAGALIEPLGALPVIAVGIFATSACAVIAILCRDKIAPQNFRYSHWPKYVAHISLPLVALAITLPGSSIAALTLVWLAIVGEEVWAWRGGSQSRAADLVRWLIKEPKPTGDLLTNAWDIDQSDSMKTAVLDWSDASVSQQIVYRTDDAGCMTVEGWLRVGVVPEQQLAIVHVAFCPAFNGIPQVETEPLDGPECETRPTLVLPWGVRWELKLARPVTAAANVVLGFYAGEIVKTNYQ